MAARRRHRRPARCAALLAGYLWLLVGVLLSGAYQVFNNWAVRTKRFSTIAIQTQESLPCYVECNDTRTNAGD